MVIRLDETVRRDRLWPTSAGGTIGVPAPASPWENRSELLRGVDWWQARGYRVKLAGGVGARDAYVAGDAKARARDLEAMFADPEVDVVQCLTGGFGSAQLLPHLDMELIAANPKPFCGYSDITALHVALRRRAGLATFYGPHLWTVGDKDTSELTRRRLLQVLGGDGRGPVPADPTTRGCAASAAAGPAGRWPAGTCGCCSACRCSTSCRSGTASTWPPCRSGSAPPWTPTPARSPSTSPPCARPPEARNRGPSIGAPRRGPMRAG
jgi:LD-carboxypeptidase N-terminal domain